MILVSLWSSFSFLAVLGPFRFYLIWANAFEMFIKSVASFSPRGESFFNETTLATWTIIKQDTVFAQKRSSPSFVNRQLRQIR